MDVNFKLDNRYFENVVNEMEPFLSEQGFTFNGENFESENKIVSVKYVDAKQMYTLLIADKKDDEE